jgi:hypothetical protein
VHAARVVTTGEPAGELLAPEHRLQGRALAALIELLPAVTRSRTAHHIAGFHAGECATTVQSLTFAANNSLSSATLLPPMPR